MFVFVFVFVYYILGTAWGATVGKYMLRLRVVNSRGEAPGLASSLVRSVVVAVSALALFVGYLWRMWAKGKKTGHDKAAERVGVRAGVRQMFVLSFLRERTSTVRAWSSGSG